MIKQLFVLLLIFISIPSTCAWTDEQDLFTENETCEFNVNPVFNSSTVDNPYWFDETAHFHGNDKTVLDPYFRSNDVVDFCMTYDVCKYVWDSSTSDYIKTACCIQITECVTLEYKIDVAGNGYYATPDNLMTKQLTDALLIKKYYQEMINAGHIDCSEFITVDDPGDNPDVFGINATANVGNTNLNAVYTGYVTISGEAEKLLMATQTYGFDMASIGGEGGSAGLANHIGISGLDEGSKSTKSAFNTIFYALIPFLFILLWIKMQNKVMKK
jgi:hypothetical protein